MVTATVPDYAHTKGAEQNRVLKARKIARWLWDRSLTYSDVLGADDKRRRAWARQAGVTPPSTSETWMAVNNALVAMEGFAEDHPEHPSVARTHADERSQWLGDVDDEPVEAVEAVEPAETVATVTVLSTPEPPSVDEHAESAVPEPPTALFKPRGWDQLAALGPIGRMDARCARCTMPAVTAVNAEWRCGNHPPQPGEWGTRLDWSPRDMDAHATHCPEGRRCYEPRCPNFKLHTPFIKADSALMDERAAANGKNRSPMHVRQAARAAQEARKARR